jgi:hypothetical protein
MSANPSLQTYSTSDPFRDSPMPAKYVYLVQEREFTKSGRPLYLLKSAYDDTPGMSRDYPYDSRVVAKILCHSQRHSDSVVEIAEKQFSKMFQTRVYIGIEYYMGSYREMVHMLTSAVSETDDV